MAPTRDFDLGIQRDEPVTQEPVTAASAAATDLELAFQLAEKQHGLQDREELAAALDHGHISEVVPVKSISLDFPDYYLAVVHGNRGDRGVAMFVNGPKGIEFAGMTTADESLPTYPFVSQGEARSAINKAGMKTLSEPKLVWGWSSESESPYYPFYQVDTSVGMRWVDSFGRVLADPGVLRPR